MAVLSAIKLPNNVTYTLKDNGALQLTGGKVTGPVTFGDSVSIDDATIGNLVVNGSASFTNGARGVIDKAKAADVTSTVDALVKYEDTEGTFSDSNIYNTSNNLIIGSTSVPGNIQIGAKNDNYGILPNTNNYNQIGSSSLYWYRSFISHYYGTNSHVVNWDAEKNIGTSSTSSAAATLGSVYFYNACAAGGTQTKTLLSNGSASSNITITLPSTTGTLALTSQIPDISGKADKSATVSTVAYDSTNKKITKTINGTTSDVVTVATLKTALGSMPASDVYSWAKASTKPTYTASEVGALPSNTTYVSTITTTAGAHSVISSKSGAVSFNVPTKTSHLTNDSGFLTNSTLYEGHLNWGNINLTGNVTPIGMSLSAEHSANRIAYLNPAAVQIEYTANGGSTWTDSGYTNDEKMWLCTGNTTIAIGQSRSGYSQSTALTTNHWTRITLTGQNGTHGYVYTSPRKLLINMSSALGVNCLIEYKTGVSDAAWQTFGTYAVSGWSGWNDIPLILGSFGGGSTQTSNNWYLRFTFKVTSTRTDSYKGYATIQGLRLFGASDWGSGSSNNGKGPFASTGHLYSYDVGANATFPAKVAASGGFTGNLTGNVTGNVSGTATNVTGTVAIANGGTGQTTAANAINTLLNGLPVWTADPTDTTYFVRQDTGGAASYGKVAFSTIWNYISGKLPSWSKASTKPSYAFSEIGSKPTTLSGYGITDAKIANGVITLGSNTITPLTSHQTVTNKGATLSWGTAVTVATIGSTNINVSLPSNPNTNTTYTFANGTNGFTVTPSGGTAQTVTVTPSITNNITGSGTSGYIAKFNGAHTLTNGPAIGTGTTKFLREDGTWATPTATAVWG